LARFEKLTPPDSNKRKIKLKRKEIKGLRPIEGKDKLNDVDLSPV